MSKCALKYDIIERLTNNFNAFLIVILLKSYFIELLLLRQDLIDKQIKLLRLVALV